MSFNDAVVEKERAVIAEDSEPQLEVEEDTFSHDIIFTLPMCQWSCTLPSSSTKSSFLYPIST